MLNNLYFGKDDAESDLARGGLLAAGFLETTAYATAKHGDKALVIGRKGSGKSAVCLTLERELRKEHRVSLITPDAISADEVRRFELPGIEQDQSKRLIWRYVFTVQIAKYIVRSARRGGRRSKNAQAALASVRNFLIDNNEVDDLTVVEKFWKVVEKVRGSLSLEAFGATASIEVKDQAQGILADERLQRLEVQLASAAAALGLAEDSKPFHLLIDQIELIWSNDRNADAMVVSLLQVAKDIRQRFPFVVCTVFLRTDIYDALNFPERDKFRTEEFRIHWDESKLIDLVETRARVSSGTPFKDKELWQRVFPSKVGEQQSATFIVSRTLQRPRDIIQLCNACRDTARTNGNETITPRDIQKAVAQYSSWKLGDLQQEWIINYPFLADILILISNTSYLLKRDTFEGRLESIKIDLEKRYPSMEGQINADFLLGVLVKTGVIGVVRKAETIYDCQNMSDIKVSNADDEFVIHPCFRDALQSTSAFELAPFAISDAAVEGRLRDRLSSMVKHEPYRGMIGVARGKPSTRLISYVGERLHQARRAVGQEKLPEEVCEEIRMSFDNIRQELETCELTGDEIQMFDVLSRAEKHIVKLNVRLMDGGWMSPKSELPYALESLAREIDDFLYAGRLREYRA